MQPWLIYILASLSLVAVIAYFLYHFLSFSVTLKIAGAVSFLLLLPITVADNGSLAPAWLVFVFESIQGNPASANAALKLILLASAIIAFVIFLFAYVSKK